MKDKIPVKERGSRDRKTRAGLLMLVGLAWGSYYNAGLASLGPQEWSLRFCVSNKLPQEPCCWPMDHTLCSRVERS